MSEPCCFLCEEFHSKPIHSFTSHDVTFGLCQCCRMSTKQNVLLNKLKEKMEFARQKQEAQQKLKMMKEKGWEIKPQVAQMMKEKYGIDVETI